MVENSHMHGFISYIQNEVKEKIIKDEPHLHIYSSSNIDMLLSDEHNNNKEGFLDTPHRFYERMDLESLNSLSTPTTNEKPPPSLESKIINNHITPFGQLVNKFVSQFTFNDQNQVNGSRSLELENTEDDVIRRVQQSERCSLHVCSAQPKSGCRFMYDRVEDRFNYLENLIRRHALTYCTSGLHGEPRDATLASQVLHGEPRDATLASQNSIFVSAWFVVMQKAVLTRSLSCCKAGNKTLSPYRVIKKSVQISGNSTFGNKFFLLPLIIEVCSHIVEDSEGQQVRLDLQKVDQLSVFPGQVIGVEGHNPSGHCLIASKVVDSLTIVEDELPPPKRQATANGDKFDSSPSKSRMLSVEVIERMKQMSPVMFDDFIKPFQVNLDENSEKAYQVYTA